MPARSKPVTQADDRVLTITRIFDAPQALVFKVWSAPEHLARWWGPRGFTVISFEADVRSGGAFRFGIRSPEGTEHWAHGTYREVERPARLVFTTAWEDTEGKTKHETLVTLSFAEEKGKTRLSFHQAPFETVECARSAQRGLEQHAGSSCRLSRGDAGRIVDHLGAEILGCSAVASSSRCSRPPPAGGGA